MTTFDPHPNLDDLIRGWHAANPMVSPTLGAGAVSSAETTAEAISREPRHLVFRPALVPSLPRRQRTITSRVRQAATRLGISESTYWRHLGQGERWCSAHRRWHPADAFYRRAGYHRDTICKAGRRAYARNVYRRGYPIAYEGAS